MFPKKGKKLPRGAFENGIASALKNELGSTHRAIKTVMRWTGASERTVKHWFAGTHGPNGRHLVVLAYRSDAVLKYFLVAAGRQQLAVGIQLIELREMLVSLIELIDMRDGR